MNCGDGDTNSQTPANTNALYYITKRDREEKWVRERERARRVPTISSTVHIGLNMNNVLCQNNKKKIGSSETGKLKKERNNNNNKPREMETRGAARNENIYAASLG